MTAVPFATGNTYSYSTVTVAPTKSVAASADQETSPTSSGDLLTISAEGLAALEKIAHTSVVQTQEVIDFKSAPQVSVEVRSWDDVLAKSKHHSPLAWALGVGDDVVFSLNKVEFVRENVRATAEKIDSHIAELLKTNGIDIGADTLNLSVDQDGVISVGKGLSGNKRETIEKLLNEDKSLGRELLFAHAQRDHADFGTKPFDVNKKRLLLDDLLNREYGVSIDDFKRRDRETDWPAGTPELVCESDDGLIDRLLNEEAALYESIKQAVYDKEFGKTPETYRYDFSYSNGVAIEKGVTDQAALDKFPTSFLTRTIFLENAAENGRLDYTVTLGPNGQMLDASVESPDGRKNREETKFLRRFIAAGSDPSTWNQFANDSRMRQYAFDARRLTQFVTGTNTEGTIVTFGTTSNRTG